MPLTKLQIDILNLSNIFRHCQKFRLLLNKGVHAIYRAIIGSYQSSRLHIIIPLSLRYRNKHRCGPRSHTEAAVHDNNTNDAHIQWVMSPQRPTLGLPCTDSMDK